MRHDDDVSSPSLAAGTPYVDATESLGAGAGGDDDFLGATIGQCCDMRSSAWSEN